MAWTSPPVYTVGEVLTAALMNAISGNFTYLHGGLGTVQLDMTNFGIGAAPAYQFYVSATTHRFFGLDTTGTGAGAAGTYGSIIFPGVNGNGPTAQVIVDAPGSSYADTRLQFFSRDGAGALAAILGLKDARVFIGPSADTYLTRNTAETLRVGGTTAGDLFSVAPTVNNSDTSIGLVYKLGGVNTLARVNIAVADAVAGLPAGAKCVYVA